MTSEIPHIPPDMRKVYLRLWRCCRSDVRRATSSGLTVDGGRRR